MEVSPQGQDEAAPGTSEVECIRGNPAASGNAHRRAEGIQAPGEERVVVPIGSNRATDPDAPPGLFTAIQEQMGLRLEPVNAMTDVMVIDKVERPGAN